MNGMSEQLTQAIVRRGATFVYLSHTEILKKSNCVSLLNDILPMSGFTCRKSNIELMFRSVKRGQNYVKFLLISLIRPKFQHSTFKIRLDLNRIMFPR